MITSLIDVFETSLAERGGSVIENLAKKKWVYVILGSGLVSILGFLIVNNFSTKPEKDYSYNEKEKAATEIKPETKIFVDVSGAVVNPNLYELPLDARLKDALKMAGGISSNGDIAWVAKNLNIAKKLKDSDKVYIPFEWEVYESSMSMNENLSNPFVNDFTSRESSGAGTNSLINVNNATKSQLESLSGIGTVYADRIIQYRPYKDIGELGRITKIPSSTILKITELITF